ncbi:MAG: MFS transporter [Ardenticatenaceae bacterium]|nr:MFS transporter [Ardenticatenaceae bacterium]
MDSKQLVSRTEIPATADEAAPGRVGVDRKWWVLLAVGVGTFMSALDGSVVNTILPVVNRSFGSGVATIEWVVTIYLLVVSGLLLSFGRLGDLRGHKPVYVTGFAVFVLGSALCGLAPSARALIGFRALQALGAAMLFANSPAILTKNFPAAQRGQALGLQATMTYLGLTAGPALGGWLTDQLSWRAVFYINVPVGLLAMLLSLRLIPRDLPAEHAEQFDLPGAATFMAGLVILLLALNQGHAWGWTSPPIVGLLAAAVLLLALFVSIERRVPNPMLDLSLFERRLFTASATSAVLNYICVYSILFLLPFYLIQGRGLNPAQAGLLLTAQPLVMSVTAPLSGTLSDRIGTRLLTTLGMVLLAVGLFLLARLGPQSAYGSVVVALAVAGLGLGIFVSPNNSAMMGSAPRHRQGIAAGVLATARNVGMVLGVGLAGAILTTVLAQGAASGSATALFAAISTAFLVVTGVAGLGALTSMVRGS